MLKCFDATVKLKLISVPAFPHRRQKYRSIACHAVNGNDSLPKNYI